MKYLVAYFKIDCAGDLMQTSRDLVASIAGDAGFESFEDTDDGLNGYVQNNLFDKKMLDAGLADFPIAEVKIDYSISDVEDKDWNKDWEDIGFDSIDIDGKVTIYDAKHTEMPTKDDNKSKINIGIEAIQAFGTGTHQTTQMVISTMLEQHLTGKRVLDCGCGTGILGIVASKLGASSIVGYDIDEWSVNNAMHNAQINGVENMDVLHGDASVLSHVCGLFDVVLANINRNILLNDMASFNEVMRKGSLLIISGYYEEDISTLLNKASTFGLKEISKKTDDNWACLLLHKE